MARKTYRGEELDVTFDLEACTHSGECLKQLPQVFDVDRKPWILPAAAGAEAVRAAVAKCPSGALAVVERGALSPEPSPESAPETGASAAAVEVRCAPNGPLLLSGPIRVLGTDGSLVHEGGKVALCRCGLSAKKPLCDGAHARAGWQDGSV